MKKIVVPVLVMTFLMQCGILFAANKSVSSKPGISKPVPSRPVPHQPALSPEFAAGAEFRKKVDEFYKREMPFRQQNAKRQVELSQKLSGLSRELWTQKDGKKKKEIHDQIAALNNEMTGLHEELARHEVEFSEFGVMMAQHRLETARLNLQRMQERNSKK